MEKRLERIQAVLTSDTAALCLSAPACRYLSGFDFTDGGVLLTADAAYLLTDSRYIEAATRAVMHMQCVCCDGLLQTIDELLKKHQIKELLLEQTVTVGTLSALQKLSARMVTDDRLQTALEAARMQKDTWEIAFLRQAQTLTEQAFTHILDFLKVGVTEREAALELEFFMRKNGADGVSFDTIAVSGANTSLPHGVPTDKPLANGDFVTMDFGALYRGYHADMTRTVAVGFVSDEQKAVYDTVLQAQTAALKVVRAGISGKAADAAARDVIVAAGYGDYFGHGTGHGVGVEIHEAPRLSPKASDAPLKVGSVVTVEPGIYLPGRFGVRIEDMVLLTENGCENFTKAPKELIIL